MTRFIKVSTTGVARKVKPPASAAGASALPSHSHTESDVTDLDHWVEADHDALDHTGLTGVGGGGNVNLWKMSKTSSQTLGSGETTVTFERNEIDGGGSVIDLANNRFVAPATALYIAFFTWMWETTAPGNNAYGVAHVGGTAASTQQRVPGTPSTLDGLGGNFPISLTSGDAVTLRINPQNSGVTARGHASDVQASTNFTLLRVT